MSTLDYLSCSRVCCARRCLGGPYHLYCPPSVRSIELVYYFRTEYILDTIPDPDSLTALIAEVSAYLPLRRACLALTFLFLLFGIAWAYSVLYKTLGWVR